MRLAIVGCGSIARQHALVLKHLGVPVSAVCGRPGSERARTFAEEFAIGAVYDRWEEMVSDENFDAYVVATPWNINEQVASRLVMRNVACLIEKPIALSSSSVRALIEKTGDSRCRLLVGYNRRFYDFIPSLRQLIAEEALLSVEVSLFEPRSEYLRVGGKELAENILLFSSSHVLDLLHFLLGEYRPVEVHRKVRTGSQNACTTALLWSQVHDVPIMLGIYYDGPGNSSIRLLFERSIAVLSPIEKLTVYRSLRVEEATDQVPIRRYVPVADNEVYAEHRFKPGFLRQMRHFLDCAVSQRDSDTQASNLEDALFVTELCEALERDGQEHRLVETL